jgi:hypothetical protein
LPFLWTSLARECWISYFGSPLRKSNIMQEITLKLTIEETNTILQALGSRPFTEVNQLISKIQQQATAQIEPAQNGQAAEAAK